MQPLFSRALVIIPTYNERENLARLVGEVRALRHDSAAESRWDVHVLIVDDSSPDGTGAIADELASADGGVHVLHRAGKQGLGTAYKAGFDFGLARGYRYLCTMDADFSHDPERLPALLDCAAAGCDLVVGSRYVAGGRVVGCTLPRKMVSWTANWLAHLLLGISIRDCTAGFRCYRCSVLETIDLDAIFSNGYSFLTEMAFLCERAGFRTGEVPITFVNRTEGASKISRWEILRAVYTLVRLRTSGLPWDKIVNFVQRRRGKRLEIKRLRD